MTNHQQLSFCFCFFFFSFVAVNALIGVPIHELHPPLNLDVNMVHILFHRTSERAGTEAEIFLFKALLSLEALPILNGQKKVLHSIKLCLIKMRKVLFWSVSELGLSKLAQKKKMFSCTVTGELFTTFSSNRRYFV